MEITILKNKNISEYLSWSIWTCEPSVFDWNYEQEEHCFIINGSVTITTLSNTVNIKKGDYVIFPKGLECVWKVHKTIKKHYMFK